jgi:hypothetical protein
LETRLLHPAEKIIALNDSLRNRAYQNELVYLISTHLWPTAGLNTAYSNDGVHPNKLGYQDDIFPRLKSNTQSALANSNRFRFYKQTLTRNSSNQLQKAFIPFLHSL